MPKPPDLATEIATLSDLPIHLLRKRWNRTFNTSVPKGFSRDLIIRSLTYKTQEGAHGGLNQATKRKLRTFAKQLEADDKAAFDTGPISNPAPNWCVNGKASVTRSSYWKMVSNIRATDTDHCR